MGKGGENLNILMAVNSAYIQHAKVTIFSLAYHNPEPVKLYLLYSELKANEIASLERFVRRRCHGELLPVFMEKEKFEKLPIRGHFSKETYYRIYAQYLLPEEEDRILWLDADLIVKKSIKNFYEKDFEGNCLIACEDKGNSTEENIKRLGLKRGKYFNAGVLLMNLEAMRKYADQEKLEHFVNENLSLFLWQDQDILNLFFEDSVLFADIEYNYQVSSGGNFNKDKGEKSAILHYVGELKPWSHAYVWDAGKYYQSYLKRTNIIRYILLKEISWLYRLWKKRSKS